jgi:hypothetical protein
MGRSRELAELGSAYDSGSSLGFRNRIINGDMRIDQRNAGASVTPTSATYTLDRWNSQVAVSSTFSIARSSVVPAGFNRSLLVTSLAATSVGSTASNTVEQYVEGFNSADLGWGAAGAQSVTLSFWVRSSLTGTFGGCFQNSDNSRSYVFSYAISAANTWEYKTVTVAGDTSGTWGTENGIGIKLRFSLGNGSTRQGSAGSWSGSDVRTVTGETQVLATNGATWQVTGVQLEAGSVATPFERRDYGRELMMCQRYFEKSYSLGTAVGSNTAIGSITSSSSQPSITTGEVNTGSVFFKVSKRSIPTVNVWDRVGNAGKCSRVQAAVSITDNQSIDVDSASTGENSFYAYSSGVSTATGAIIHFTASAEL